MQTAVGIHKVHWGNKWMGSSNLGALKKMTSQTAGQCCFGLGTVCSQSKFLKYTVNQMRLCQVDCAIIVALGIYHAELVWKICLNMYV